MRPIRGVDDLGMLARHRSAEPEPGRGSRGRRPLPDQRRGCAGRHRDRGRRQCRQPGAAGRAALRPGGPLPPRYRDTREAIENIRLLAPSGERVSLAQLCKVRMADGASTLYREANSRYVAIKYSCPRPRPGQHRGGGHPQGQHAGETAAPATASNGRASTRARSAPRHGC